MAISYSSPTFISRLEKPNSTPSQNKRHIQSQATISHQHSILSLHSQQSQEFRFKENHLDENSNSFHFHEAESLDKAFAIMSQHKIDILLIDIDVLNTFTKKALQTFKRMDPNFRISIAAMVHNEKDIIFLSHFHPWFCDVINDNVSGNLFYHYMEIICEKKRIHMDLKKHVAQMHTYLESCPDMIINLNLEGQIISGNHQAHQKLHYHQGQLNNMNLAEIVHVEDVDTVGYILTEQRSFARKSPSYQIHLEDRKGNIILVKLNVYANHEPSVYHVPQRLPSRSRTHLSCYIQDITTERHLEQEVEMIKVELITSERGAALHSIIAGVAHEINNPASVVQSDLESMSIILKKEHANSPLQILSKKIKRSTQAILRVTNIVSSLKKTFRKRDWHESHIEDEIKQVLIILGNKLSSDVIIKTIFLPTPRIQVHGNDIGQVFLNLISNALRAVQGKGIITIETKLKIDGDIFISIEDNGVGIEDHHIDHIFKAYYTSQEVDQGMGLGLAISKGIIQDHGGTIDLKWTKHKIGTCFNISLPQKARMIKT